jgi:hypothetical protein
MMRKTVRRLFELLRAAVGFGRFRVGVGGGGPATPGV